MPVFKDITGSRFGRLVAIKYLGKRAYLCRCDCGTEKKIAAAALRSGATKSCGCLWREAVTKHGGHRTKTYAVWHSMRQRCNNPSDHAYKNYGGRGISICKRWDDYSAFLKDMGEKPDGLSLDRINNELGYSPENCRWATNGQQLSNTRQCVYIEHNGERRTIAQWSRITGLSHRTISYRIGAGWPTDKALLPRL